MRRSLAVVALATLLAVPSDLAFGFSKTAQKVAFATGLLAFGGVVRALIRRDRDRTEQRVRELRAEWGDPVTIVTAVDGFDTIRVEKYERDGETAWATFRNGRLVTVRRAHDELDPTSADTGDGVGRLDRVRPPHGGGGSVSVRPDPLRPEQ
jgi:hypothetical protein